MSYVKDRRKAEIIDYFAAGGPTLPESPRAAKLRAELVSAARRAADAQDAGVSRMPAPIRSRSWAPALARAAVAVLVGLIVLAGIGVGSTSAMPGDPIYSVKRFIEGAHLLILPEGQARADALLGYAEERMDELEYTGARGMKEWYGPLASGAQSRIEGAYDSAGGLEQGRRSKVRLKALKAEEHLQSLINKALPYASGESLQELERVMERARRRIGTPDEGNPSGTGGNGNQQSPGATEGQQEMQKQEQQGQQQDGQQSPDRQSSPEGDSGQQQRQQQDSGQQGEPSGGLEPDQVLFAPQKNHGTGSVTGDPAADTGRGTLKTPAYDAGD